MKPSDVLVAAQIASKEDRLYRCLTCSAMTEFRVISDWLMPGGRLYNIAVREHGQLRSDKLYHFPTEGSTVTEYSQHKILNVLKD